MLETPLHPPPATAQVGSISREVATGKPLAKWFKRWLTPQRLHADRSRKSGMFFVSCKSYKDFAQKIGSRHSAKKKVLEMVI